MENNEMIPTQSAMLFYATSFFPLAILFLNDFKENMKVMSIHFQKTKIYLDSFSMKYLKSFHFHT